MDDPSEAHRIVDAKEREDAFLENAVREGDTHIENNSAVTPRSDLHEDVVTPATPRMSAPSSDPVHGSIGEPPRLQKPPMSYEDMLEENDFHDMVNQDQEMYDAIEAIPTGDDMVGSIIATVQKHVSEVWSPPRVTALAHEYGLTPGSAYDIETNDELNQPWDFD